MSAKLNAGPSDAATADAVMPAMIDVGFTSDLPTIAAAWAGALVAYGFGTRPNEASGNTSSTGGNPAALPDPGPVNEAIAGDVSERHRQVDASIFAQRCSATWACSSACCGSR